MTIHPDTTLGPVCLTVSDLERSLTFYTSLLGLKAIKRVKGIAYLGVNSQSSEHLLTLVERRDAVQKQPDTTGLYHFAILVPSRVDLALALRNLTDKNYPLEGAADHLVSEAIYLKDPEGNGIEIYRDRPRNEWQRVDGLLKMATNPLDLPSLFADLDQIKRSWTGMPKDTKIGHIHLQVSDLGKAEKFYVDILGFEVTIRYELSALFLSTGGYHHHIGLNTWAGTGAGPPQGNSTGLRYFTIRLPDMLEEEKLVERLTSNKIEVHRHRESGLAFDDPFKNSIFVSSDTGPRFLELSE